MMNWTLAIPRGAEMAQGVQLDFMPHGLAGHESIPSLAAGDRLLFTYATHGGHQGTVLSTSPDNATIEIEGARWSIRRATADDSPIPRGAWPRSIAWIVEAREP